MKNIDIIEKAYQEGRTQGWADGDAFLERFVKKLKEELENEIKSTFHNNVWKEFFFKKIDKIMGDFSQNHSPQEGSRPRSSIKTGKPEDTSKDICENCGYRESTHKIKGYKHPFTCKKFTAQKKKGCGEMFLCKDGMGAICGNNVEELLCPKCQKEKKDET